MNDCGRHEVEKGILCDHHFRHGNFNVFFFACWFRHLDSSFWFENMDDAKCLLSQICIFECCVFNHQFQSAEEKEEKMNSGAKQYMKLFGIQRMNRFKKEGKWFQRQRSASEKWLPPVNKFLPEIVLNTIGKQITWIIEGWLWFQQAVDVVDCSFGSWIKRLCKNILVMLSVAWSELIQPQRDFKMTANNKLLSIWRTNQTCWNCLIGISKTKKQISFWTQWLFQWKAVFSIDFLGITLDIVIIIQIFQGREKMFDLRWSFL